MTSVLSYLLLLVSLSSMANSGLTMSNIDREDLYRNEQDLIEAKKIDLSPEEFKFIARALEKVVDEVLTDYIKSKISLEEAIQKITNPFLLKGSGYVLIIHEGFNKLVGTPTLENQIEWAKKMLGGGVRIDGRIRQVFIEWPVIENGESLFSRKNKLVAEGLLFVSAEELYHVVQYLKAQNGSPENISEFFLNMNKKELMAYENRLRTLVGDDYWGKQSFAEIDVYVKIIEMIGADLMPKWLQHNHNQLRMTIDPHKIPKVKKAFSGLSCRAIFL